MRNRCLYLTLVALSGLFGLAATASGQTWTQTTARINSWKAVVLSADGTKMAAAAWVNVYGDGRIYTSLDSGATWAASDAPTTNWYAIAASADGAKLAAAGDAGIYTSADYGATWMWRTNIVLRALVSSADGTILAGGWGTGWISIDSGATWTRSVAYASRFASSADGTKLVAVGFLGSIMTSPDVGLTWRLAFLPPAGMLANCLGSSADGSCLAAGVVPCPCPGGAPGPIFVSSDGGLNWVPANSPVSDWNSIASSADGTRWVAGDYRGVYISTDSATTWDLSLAVGAETSVASSADGAKLVAAVNGGGINVRQSTPSPSLSISPSGTNLLLSWTVPSMDFLLQQNSDLTTINWTDVAVTPTLNLTNLHYELIVSPTNAHVFYRLKY